MKQSERRGRFLFAAFLIVQTSVGVGCGNGGAPAASPESAKNQPEPGVTDPDLRAAQAPSPRTESLSESTSGDRESVARPMSVLPTDTRADEPKAALKSVATPSRAYRDANRDLENALRAVGAIDCSLACKALASMTRAVMETCSLARETQEKNECAEEKKILESAVVRVRNSCGVCRDSG